MPYQVTDTQEFSTITRGGRETKTYRVWIVTDKGASGYVDVSERNWKPDKLKKVLEEKAKSLDMAFDVAGS